MLTLRAAFNDGQVTFIDEVPFTGEHQVLVTFLDDDSDVVVLPKKERDTDLTVRELEVTLGRR